MSVSDYHMTLAFVVLYKDPSELAEQLHRFESENLVSSTDHDQDSRYSIIKRFRDSNGYDCIKKIFNVTPKEKQKLHDKLQPGMNGRWNW